MENLHEKCIFYSVKQVLLIELDINVFRGEITI